MAVSKKLLFNPQASRTSRRSQLLHNSWIDGIILTELLCSVAKVYRQKNRSPNVSKLSVYVFIAVQIGKMEYKHFTSYACRH